MRSIDIEIGDKLTPRPLWNKSERRPNQLPQECEVLDIASEEYCQSGLMVKVKTLGGRLQWIDSEWFEGVNA